MAFNKHLSFNENIKLGLWNSGKSFTQMAKEIPTSEDAIKTIISARFKRGEKTPPLYKKVFIYLEKNCDGFTEYCLDHKITIAS